MLTGRWVVGSARVTFELYQLLSRSPRPRRLFVWRWILRRLLKRRRSDRRRGFGRQRHDGSHRLHEAVGVLLLFLIFRLGHYLFLRSQGSTPPANGQELPPEGADLTNCAVMGYKVPGRVIKVQGASTSGMSFGVAGVVEPPWRATATGVTALISQPPRLPQPRRGAWLLKGVITYRRADRQGPVIVSWWRSRCRSVRTRCRCTSSGARRRARPPSRRSAGDRRSCLRRRLQSLRRVRRPSRSSSRRRR